MKYRREIDGLRAIAILPVILFHMGISVFSGGYLGVDIFFVISGFLITSIINQEMESGKFTFLGFYERRARRILPALYLIILITIPVAYILLLPSDLVDYAKSVIATNLFVANHYFASSSGYFDQAAELKPLVHTWSLSVEEQFYILFPVILAGFLTAKNRGWVHLKWITFLALFVLSLLLAQIASHYKPTENFYFLISRFWELLLGAIFACWHNRIIDTGKKYTGSLSCLGLLLTVIPIFFFTEQTAHPSVLTLIPALGVGLLLSFATPSNMVGQILGNRLFVIVGLLSYSAYLIHQPILAFVRYRYSYDFSGYEALLLLAVIFFLAFLVWRYIEQPFRSREKISSRQIFLISFVGFFCITVSAGIILSKQGFPHRLPPNIEWESLGQKLQVKGDVCKFKAANDYEGISDCVFGDAHGKKTLVLYGDSHAQAISSQLDLMLKANGIRGIRLRAEECQVVPQLVDARKIENSTKCEKNYERLKTYLAKKADYIVVAARWTLRLYPVEGYIDQQNFDNHEGGVEYNSPRRSVVRDGEGGFTTAESFKHLAILKFLEDFNNIGKPIILIYPIPELGWDIAKLNFYKYRETGKLLESISTSLEVYKDRNRYILRILDDFQGINILKLKTEPIFCSLLESRCLGQLNTVPLYYDDDHLSDAGAELIVSKIELMLH